LRRIEPAVLEILNQMDRRFVPEETGDPELGVEVVLLDSASAETGVRR